MVGGWDGIYKINPVLNSVVVKVKGGVELGKNKKVNPNPEEGELQVCVLACRLNLKNTDQI